MSANWIKMRKNLLTDPRVVRISSALKADRFRTVGGIFSAWCLFDEQTEDGILDGYTPEIFDDMIGFPGLALAMASVGWLEVSEGFIVATRFEEHNGQSAKRRAQDIVRKMSARKADKCPQTKRTKCGPDKIREEKNRVVVEEPPPPLDFKPSKPDSPHRRATMADVYKLGRGQLPPIPDECCEKFFDRMEADGWINDKGFPLADWRARFREWATAWAKNAETPNRKSR